MSKLILLTRLTVFDEDFNMYDGIEEMISNLNSEGHKVSVVSHNSNYKIIIKSILEETFDFKVGSIFRNKVKEVVNEQNASKIILVGSSDFDLFLAASKKMLIINPGWSIKQEDKPARYGITLDKPSKLFEAIRIIDNQNKWYFKLNIDQNTTVLALTSANTYNRVATETEILEGFKRLLKSGDRSYFNTLYFHLISGVMKSPELRSVDIWGIFPSSSYDINQEIEELKERCRYLTGKRMKDPLFIRHTTVEKSRYTKHETRLDIGCAKHFDSITLNPYYSQRVKNKVICVIDDYITNGTSFETARNLLYKAGAKKVILVALGRYKKGNTGIYQHESYDLIGDVTTRGYQYNLKSKQCLVGEYDNDAREEVKSIYKILKD